MNKCIFSDNVIIKTIHKYLPLSDRMNPINRKWTKVFHCSDTYEYLKNHKTISRQRLFNKSCKDGKKDIISLLLQKGGIYWKDALEKSARGGHLDLVIFFASKGVDSWTSTLTMAIKGDHIDLVNFILENYNSVLIYDTWRYAMAMSARKGNEYLVNLCIERGASNWNEGMINAARGGHKYLIDFFIVKGASKWGKALEEASRGGNKYLVDFFIDKIKPKAIKTRILKNAIYGAARGGHTKILLYLIGLGKGLWSNQIGKLKIDFFDTLDDMIITYATLGGHTNIIRYFIRTKSYHDNLALSLSLNDAINKGYVDVVETFINNEPDNDWNDLMTRAIRCNNEYFVNFFIDKGANHWNMGLLVSAHKGYRKLAELFIRKGVDDWDGTNEIYIDHGYVPIGKPVNHLDRINNIDKHEVSIMTSESLWSKLVTRFKGIIKRYYGLCSHP